MGGHSTGVGEWTKDTLSGIDKFHEGERAKVMPGEV